jgi:hypothetical protein
VISAAVWETTAPQEWTEDGQPTSCVSIPWWWWFVAMPVVWLVPMICEAPAESQSLAQPCHLGSTLLLIRQRLRLEMPATLLYLRHYRHEQQHKQQQHQQQQKLLLLMQAPPEQWRVGSSVQQLQKMARQTHRPPQLPLPPHR